jgi:hypothetical protein
MEGELLAGFFRHVIPPLPFEGFKMAFVVGFSLCYGKSDIFPVTDTQAKTVLELELAVLL